MVLGNDEERKAKPNYWLSGRFERLTRILRLDVVVDHLWVKRLVVDVAEFANTASTAIKDLRPRCAGLAIVFPDLA